MSIIFNKIESAIKYLKNMILIFYYKVKYGKRLKIGKKVRFRKGFTLYIAPDAYLEIGDRCFFNNYCSIICRKKIIIGEHNLFGESVKMYDHNHAFNNQEINRGTTYKEGEIIIGNNNWFATHVVILKNTKVGNNNVISAGSIINSKFESDMIISNKGNREYETVPIRYE